MDRARPDLFVHPGLGAALRHLRTRTAPPRRQADIASAAGISIVWLSHLETGKGHPTHTTLDALLAALGSTREELDGLLAARPWEVGEGAEWAAPAAAAPPPAAPLATPAAPPTLAGPLEATRAAPPAAGRVGAQAAELGALFALLGPDDQAAVLADVRRRTRH